MTNHIHHCPACRKPLFRQDARLRKNDGLRALHSGVAIMVAVGQATSVRCSCGKRTVFVRGTL